jgi:pterin-4a-carbinolamine dehydratase
MGDPRLDEALRADLNKYRQEQKEWRRMIARSKIEENARVFTFLNNLLFFLIVALFAAQIFFHPMSDIFSLETALFLVSLKLIMMIHSASRFNHFQFWILHSIETRVEGLNERLDRLEDALDRAGKAPGDAPR